MITELTEKKIKFVIMVNPNDKTVTWRQASGLEDYYKLIGCRMIDIGNCRLYDKDYNVIVDDEGLLKPATEIKCFGIKGYPLIFAGIGLIAEANLSTGDLITPTGITNDDVKKKIIFFESTYEALTYLDSFTTDVPFKSKTTVIDTRKESYEISKPEFSKQEQSCLEHIDKGNNSAWLIARHEKYLITSIRRALNNLVTKKEIEVTGHRYNEETNRNENTYSRVLKLKL